MAGSYWLNSRPTLKPLLFPFLFARELKNRTERASLGRHCTWASPSHLMNCWLVCKLSYLSRLKAYQEINCADFVPGGRTGGCEARGALCPDVPTSNGYREYGGAGQGYVGRSP